MIQVGRRWHFGSMVDLSEMVAARQPSPVVSSLAGRQVSQNLPIVPGQIIVKLLLGRPREHAASQQFGQRFAEVVVESHPCLVEVDLREHEVTGQHESLSRMYAAFVNAQAQTATIAG